MTAKPSVAVRIASGLVGIVLVAALFDELGKFRWFWPYDQYALGLAMAIGLLWFAICGPKLMAWADEEIAKRNREEEDK